MLVTFTQHPRRIFIETAKLFPHGPVEEKKEVCLTASLFTSSLTSEQSLFEIILLKRMAVG